MRRISHSISSFFPYTTLFRSIQMIPGGRAGSWASFHISASNPIHPSSHAQHSPGNAGHEKMGESGLTPIYGTIDRKSTRLNFSHTVSSYAVFCLKKKKKQIKS